MTLDQIYSAINKADPKDKLIVAESSLEKYDGDDLDIVRPWVMEMAALGQDYDD